MEGGKQLATRTLFTKMKTSMFENTKQKGSMDVYLDSYILTRFISTYSINTLSVNATVSAESLTEEIILFLAPCHLMCTVLILEF